MVKDIENMTIEQINLELEKLYAQLEEEVEEKRGKPGETMVQIVKLEEALGLRYF